jgi:hypothetical protein
MKTGNHPINNEKVDCIDNNVKTPNSFLVHQIIPDSIAGGFYNNKKASCDMKNAITWALLFTEYVYVSLSVKILRLTVNNLYPYSVK